MKSMIAAMVLLLALGFGVGQINLARANYLSMSCGGYWAYGGSFKSPSAIAYTATHEYCTRYFTTSAVINGNNYSYGGGWDPPSAAYPIDTTTSIFSTHNACFTISCNGYVGTSDY